VVRAQVRKVHRMQFMKELTEFWDKAGSPLCKIPVIGGTELNLHLLHTTVAKLGGYGRVCAERRWMEVADRTRHPRPHRRRDSSAHHPQPRPIPAARPHPQAGLAR
jgi:hypothetical protein